MSAAPRRVVVGYDGSARARKALDAARRVAAPGARVKVVYAHRVSPELTYYEFFRTSSPNSSGGRRRRSSLLAMHSRRRPG